MRYAQGDIWNFLGLYDAICVTTNGTVTKNGEAVMGRGIALEAKTRFPGLEFRFGKMLQAHGNEPMQIETSQGTAIVSFPTKPDYTILPKDGQVRDFVVSHMVSKFRPGQKVPGWACKSNLNLIEVSAIKLKEMADYRQWRTVAVPQPGCGNGELLWEDVRPVLERHFDDRFIIVRR
jgi:hypothetical protein